MNNNFFSQLKYFIIKLSKSFQWLYFIQNYIMDISFIEGESMLPTFKKKGTVVLIDKFSHIFFKPKINNIISLYHPYNKRIILCKRLISISNKGEKIWVEGDNKNNSLDSRDFGLINYSLINGIIRLQIFPLIKWKFPPLNNKL